ncbi:MAG: DUF937 domain-containing protein [Pseudomonadota bacterium]
MRTIYDLFRDAFEQSAGDMLGQTYGQMLAQNYGLSRTQIDQALLALAPAFSLGLKRAFSDPNSLAGLVELIRSTSTASLPGLLGGSDPLSATRAQDALGLLFGSPHASKAIADQVARLSGVPAERILQMMPATASAVLAGLQRDLPFQAGPFGDLLNAFIDGFHRGRPEPGPSVEPPPQVAADMLTSFFTGFQRGRSHEDDDAAALEAEGEAETDDPQNEPAAPFSMDDLFQAGSEVQKSHFDAMNGLFEALYDRSSRS